MESTQEVVWLICVRRALRKELRRDPTPYELAQRFGVPLEQMERSLDTIAQLKSFGLDFDRLDDAELSAFLEGNDPVKPVPESLTPNQAKRVRESLGTGPYDDLTLEELKREFEASDERFRKEFREILRKRGLPEPDDLYE